jgi:hypothetical protein
MVKSSTLNPKTTISSVLGSDYTEPANEDEKQLGDGGIGADVDQMYEQLDDVEEEDESIDENYDESLYESDEESNADSSQPVYSPFCEKVTRKKELPTSLFAGKKFLFIIKINFEFIFFFEIVFADARQKEEDPIRRYFTSSKLYKFWSFMTLPVTLPIDLTYAMTRR